MDSLATAKPKGKAKPWPRPILKPMRKARPNGHQFPNPWDRHPKN